MLIFLVINILIFFYVLIKIDKVSIMGKDRYLVAYTTDTLLVGDLTHNKLSEVGLFLNMRIFGFVLKEDFS